jgi:hypothetical protein
MKDKVNMSRRYGCDRLAAHVLDGYYGWKKSGVYNYIAYGGHNFDRETIGRNKYNSTRSKLSKTCRRLQYRGLVTLSYGNEHVSWSGINLTEEGIENAKAGLSNKKWFILPKCSMFFLMEFDVPVEDADVPF